MVFTGTGIFLSRTPFAQDTYVGFYFTLLFEIASAIAYFIAASSSLSLFLGIAAYVAAMAEDMQQLKHQLALLDGSSSRSQRNEAVSILIDAIKFHHIVIEYGRIWRL